MTEQEKVTPETPEDLLRLAQRVVGGAPSEAVVMLGSMGDHCALLPLDGNLATTLLQQNRLWPNPVAAVVYTDRSEMVVETVRMALHFTVPTLVAVVFANNAHVETGGSTGSAHLDARRVASEEEVRAEAEAVTDLDVAERIAIDAWRDGSPLIARAMWERAVVLNGGQPSGLMLRLQRTIESGAHPDDWQG